MITHFETNKVYLAKGLSSVRYRDIARHLANILDSEEIVWEQLPQTISPFHIWARDYMPVQVNKEKYIQFKYQPYYLRKNPEYKPDTPVILSELDIQVIDSNIVLDGGNVISCGNKVILTDKIIKENPHYERNMLIDTLSMLLEAEVVLIPQDIYEEYGHSDGMVRYVGDGHVLLNNYCDFDKTLRKRLLSALKPHFNISELHYGSYTDKSWAYINFLHIGQHIFIPIMKDKLAEKACNQIAEIFSECRCYPVWSCESIVDDGGALNCITWNILADLPIDSQR